MALMIGRKPGQRVMIGTRTMTVIGVDEHTVSVRIRPGGAFTFTTETERLTLTGDDRTLATSGRARHSCESPHRPAYAWSDPNATNQYAGTVNGDEHAEAQQDDPPAIHGRRV